MENTPNYIKSLLMPTAKAQTGRKAWSIDLETVWLPFFCSTNVMGDTAIPLDALGAPLRLAYDKDGSVKFSRNGRPVTRIAKPIAQSILLVRENFTATLRDYAVSVATKMPDEYKALAKLARTQGEPIISHDRVELEKAIKLQIEQAVKDAEAKAKAEAEAEAKAEVPPEPVNKELPRTREPVKVS